MAYTLEALLVPAALRERIPASLSHLQTVSLQQQLLLIPVTEGLADEAKGQYGETHPPGTGPLREFWRLTPGVTVLALHLAQGGPIAYVEANFFGGHGTQAAIVWQADQILLGPIKGPTAINEALRVLGVRAGEAHDEFDAVGLGQHRHTEEWLGSRDG